MKPIYIKVTCTCSKPAELRRDRRFYNNKPAWYCSTFPDHYAYVEAHAKTQAPMGTLADPQTHGARFKLHALFDPIWRDGYMTRTEAYHMLAKLMGTRPSQTHTGYMDKEQCEIAKQKVSAWLDANPVF